ncbi:MAG: hypothetical protein SVK08_01915 [Halobacteriota archaeon]|nr:hypothetical protein [Halobacteriota archaeon]
MAVDSKNVVAEKFRDFAHPASFFNVIKFDEPKSHREEFRWARKLYETVGIIQQSIRKLATYPITEVVIEDDTRDGFYGDTLIKKMKIKSESQRIGMDYYTYGNAYITPIFPFIRMMKCKSCGKINNYDEIKALRYSSLKFTGKCSKCGKISEFTPKDIPLRNNSKVKIKLWYPGDIEIAYNEISGDKRYIYTIPPGVRRRIQNGDIWFIKTTPLEFLQAVNQRKNRVELNSSSVYHMKMPGPTMENNTPIGRPFVSGSWRDAFILLVLKKAQETMASDRFVSYRILYPGNRTQDPIATMNLGNFKSNIQNMVKRFYSDPNEIGISPFPVEQTHIGGDGKPYNPAPEIEAHKKDLLADLGVPYEFIYGGLTYSGSSVSIRMLENLMLNYRQSLEEALEFIANAIGKFFRKEPVGSIRFTSFKMADDIQQKQYIGNLNAQRKVSDQTVLEDLGLDFDVETARIKEESDKKRDIMISDARVSAEANGEARVIDAKYQAKAAMTNQEVSSSIGSSRPSGYTYQTPSGMAKSIMKLNDIERADRLREMQASDPDMYAEVIKKINPYNSVDMTPLPEQKPPTRAPDKGVM